jgi:NDP-4-keto-2,6-dideoxyhexose 3-C-methyltransferase
VYREIAQCRICGNFELDPVLDLGWQALTGVFPKDLAEAVERGPLQLLKCRTIRGQDNCGLVQLKHSFSPEQMYGVTYGYRSGLNPSMVQHLRTMAAYIKQLIRLRPGDVALDIGSNDGTLLAAMDEPGVELIGMDPSGLKFQEHYPAQARLIADFFSAARFREELGSRRAKVVTSIAMFYDLESPLQFMQDVFEVLSDDGIWVFEQSYLPQMLAMNSYDTVCHEHLEYYALKQISWMARRVGFRIVDIQFNTINGGSFSVTATKSKFPTQTPSLVGKTIREEMDHGLDELSTYQEFAGRVLRHRDSLMNRLQELHQDGRLILGYGASTKGNVILQFCGIGCELVPCIAEVNEDKFGAYTPGTHIPIISEQEARTMNPDVFMVLPWHFRSGIGERER